VADFEIQIQVADFLQAQLAGLQARRICPPPPRKIGGIEFRIDRIEFGANSIRHSKETGFPVFYEYGGLTYGITAEGFQTQVVQEVVVHVTTTADVLAHPDADPVVDYQVSFKVVVDLDYYSVDTQCFLRTGRAQVEGVKLPTLPPGVPAVPIEDEVKRLVEGSMPSRVQSLNFAYLLPDAKTKIQNAGITVTSDLKLLVLRAEVGAGSSYSDVPWSNFYKGFVSDHLQGARWGWFIPANLIEATFANAVWQAAAEEEGDLLEVTSVGSRYSGAGSVAHVDTTIHALLHLPFPFGTQTLHPTPRVDISVPEPRHLAFDLYVPDVPSIVAQMDMLARFVLTFLLTSIAEYAEGLLEAKVAKLPTPKAKGVQCWQVAPLHRRCTYALPSPAAGGTEMRIDTLNAQPDRLMLSGKVRIPEYTPATLETRVEGFGWKIPEFSCGSADLSTAAAFIGDVEHFAPLRAKVIVEQSGSLPGYLCRAEVVNDPLGKFPSSSLRWDSDRLPTTIVLEVGNPGPEYAAHPYPIDVLITTTLGTRLVRIPPAPALTEADVSRLKALAIFAVGNCKLLAHPPGFNLKWLIDPPFIDIYMHRWTIVITGLLLGDSVKLLDSGGHELVHATALAGLATTLSAVLAPPSAGLIGAATLTADVAEGEEADHELMLLRLRNGEPAPPAPGMGIEIRQQALEATAAISLNSRCRELIASALWSRDGFVAVLDDGLVAYELRDGGQPRAIGHWALDEVRGAREWPQGLLAFTEDGLFNLDREQHLHRLGPEREPSRILDVAVGDGIVHVLTESGLETRSAQLTPRSSVPGEDGRCLVRLGPRLLVGGPHGIAVYRPGEAGRLEAQSVRSCPDLDVSRLELSTVSGSLSILATLTDGSVRALVLDEGDRAQVVASYPSSPWLAGGIRLGDQHLIQLSDDRRDLQLSRLGESRKVGADATDLVEPEPEQSPDLA
jgi:hypothetical protein